MPGTALRDPHVCFHSTVTPREVGIITVLPNFQMRKGRLEGVKTFVQGHTAKEVMALGS